VNSSLSSASGISRAPGTQSNTACDGMRGWSRARGPGRRKKHTSRRRRTQSSSSMARGRTDGSVRLGRSFQVRLGGEIDAPAVTNADRMLVEVFQRRQRSAEVSTVPAKGGYRRFQQLRRRAVGDLRHNPPAQCRASVMLPSQRMDGGSKHHSWVRSALHARCEGANQIDHDPCTGHLHEAFGDGGLMLGLKGLEAGRHG
jgi:hypothetical protein